MMQIIKRAFFCKRYSREINDRKANKDALLHTEVKEGDGEVEEGLDFMKYDERDTKSERTSRTEPDFKYDRARTRK